MTGSLGSLSVDSCEEAQVLVNECRDRAEPWTRAVSLTAWPHFCFTRYVRCEHG